MTHRQPALLEKFWQPMGSVLFLVFAWVSLGFVVLGMALCFFISRKAVFFWMHLWGKLTRCFLRVFCGIRVKVIGAEHIPAQPCVYIVKHQSTFETFVLPGLLPPHVFVVKKELLKLPVFGWGLQLLRSIAIDRKDGMKALKQVISKGKENLKIGFSIVVFPEGTRVAVGESPEFHKSAALLARGFGCSVVPIAHNAGLLWPKGRFVKQRGCITIEIGSPISVEDHTLDSLNQALHAWMKMRMAVLEGLRGH